MNDYNLKLNIYSFEIIITTDDDISLSKIEKDFSYFTVKNSKHYKKKLHIKISKDTEYSIPKNLIATKQTQNSIYYDVKPIRYNDYYGKAITVFNYEKETVEIYYKSQEFLHELIYLIVLSRCSKYMDSIGLHKVHACGIVVKDTNIIFMMPSKGGKSTMFLEMIRDIDTKIISDDTPVITKWGDVKPFPLRIGLDDKNKLFSYFPYLRDENLYEFKREIFCEKTLVDLTDIKNQIGTGNKTILINGSRSTRTKARVNGIGRIRMFKYLITHMIVGMGLPMILEYFLEHTFIDSLRNLKNLFSRVIAAIFLVARSDPFEMELSDNTVENAKKLRDIIQ